MSSYDLPMDDLEEFMNGSTNALAYLRCAEYLDLKNLERSIMIETYSIVHNVDTADLKDLERSMIIEAMHVKKGTETAKLKQLKRDLPDYKEKRFCSLLTEWYPVSKNGKRKPEKSVRNSVMVYCKNNAISILDFREKVINDEEDMSSCELSLSVFTEFISGYYSTVDSYNAYLRCGEYLALENIRSKIRSVKQQDEWKKRKRMDMNDENEDPRKKLKHAKLARRSRAEAEAKAKVEIWFSGSGFRSNGTR